MSDKPVVWIVSLFRHLPRGLSQEELMKALPPHMAAAITELMTWEACPFAIQLNTYSGGGIFQGRNRSITDFMLAAGSPEDRFFTLDSDLLAEPKDFVEVLRHDLAIIGGMYTARADNGHWILNKLPYPVKVSEHGVMPVMELGQGFKCTKRAVFTKVLADNPWLKCEDEVSRGHPFFCFYSMGPVWDKKLWAGCGRALTEDYWFDWLARESGFTTHVTTRVRLRHYDDATGKTYPAQFPPDPGLLPPETKEP